MRKLGFECKLYRGTPVSKGDDGKYQAGFVAATEENEVNSVKDTKLTMAPDEVEASNRKSKFKKYLSGMVDGGIEMDFDHDSADPHQQAIMQCAVTDKILPIYIELDEGIGLEADFEIFMKESNQPLQETQKISFTAKPSANAGREPEFHGGDD